MNRFFRHLPPKVQAWIIDHGWLVWLTAACGLLAIVYVSMTTYSVNRYVTGEVIAFSDQTGDDGYFGRFVFLLPDGTQAQVITTSAQVAARVGTRACLAERLHRSGAITYAFSHRNQCDPK